MANDRASFEQEARGGAPVLLRRTLISDHLTPVLAYRALVRPDDRTAPSFLFESVEQGVGGKRQVGQTSILASQPRLEVIARGHEVTVRDHDSGTEETTTEENPLDVPRRLAGTRALGTPAEALPDCFTGGWVGFIGYDTVRWLEPGKLGFENAPTDDRGLPDMHLGLYQDLVTFNHVNKTINLLVMVDPDRHESVESAFSNASQRLKSLSDQLTLSPISIDPGFVDVDVSEFGRTPEVSNFDRPAFENAVKRSQRYIKDGDAFQVVLSQRFRRETNADPFDIYRALRVVNPSPYQIYLQAEGCILVAASPEILCRVRDGVLTSRPLAGTRRRGRNEAEDLALEKELLADEKERAEHVMLVDLGRNDLGRVCEKASIEVESCMSIERFSHVMHISSTITGKLRKGLDQWDALRATLPVGTVSGAPKVRAMQIIDELEPTRRGPYGGGIGVVGLGGGADIALALRTMVIQTTSEGAPWTVDLQAGAGIVLDSVPGNEYEETVLKAAALGRAIDLAEQAFEVQ